MAGGTTSPGSWGSRWSRSRRAPSWLRGSCGPSISGQAGERTFIGIASCGFDSEANRIANETRLVRGNLVYAYGAIRALISRRPARFELTLDGDRQYVVTGYSVGAANSKAYGGGMYAAPGAELDDGLLDIVTLATMSKRRFLFSLMPKVL